MPVPGSVSPFRPRAMGRNLMVLPAGCRFDTGARTPLYLGPGKAFGSGGHETTASCVQQMEDLGSLDGARVLDVGTGTGILSVASLLLGAASVVALDVDLDAVRSCARNFRINSVEDRTVVFCGTMACLRDTGRFDLVMANIYGDIIVNEAAALAGCLAAGGRLILSGIDYADATEVQRSLSALGLERRRTLFLEEYVTQVWKRPRRRGAGDPSGPA